MVSWWKPHNFYKWRVSSHFTNLVNFEPNRDSGWGFYTHTWGCVNGTQNFERLSLDITLLTFPNNTMVRWYSKVLYTVTLLSGSLNKLSITLPTCMPLVHILTSGNQLSLSTFALIAGILGTCTYTLASRAGLKFNGPAWFISDHYLFDAPQFGFIASLTLPWCTRATRGSFILAPNWCTRATSGLIHISS